MPSHRKIPSTVRGERNTRSDTSFITASTRHWGCFLEIFVKRLLTFLSLRLRRSLRVIAQKYAVLICCASWFFYLGLNALNSLSIFISICIDLETFLSFASISFTKLSTPKDRYLDNFTSSR